MKKAIACLLLCATLFACLTGMAEEQKHISSPRDAEDFVRILLGDTPEALDGAYEMTVQMTLGVKISGGFPGLKKSLAALGEIQEIGSAFAADFAGKPAFHVPCRFSLIPVDFVLVLENSALAGLTTAEYTEQKEAADENAANMREIDLALNAPGLGELPGTLTLPEGDGPFPAVVLIHGSGVSNRDEAVLNVAPFRDLAEGLAEKGVAVYRFDKRTYVYGVQLASDTQFTLMDESVYDAVAAVQLLAGQPGIDPDRIFVLGHSLGGTAIPAIDQALKDAPVKARGYVLMAPGARPLDVMMREQYEFLYSLQPEITEEMQAQKDQLFRELDQLEHLDALSDTDRISNAYVPYWRWLAAYDVLGLAGEITVPCLLLQGEEDYQATMEDFALWKKAVEGHENWSFISYPDLVHVFITGKKTDGGQAYMKKEKMSPAVIRDIADFVTAH